jgi:hypothetical protein
MNFSLLQCEESKRFAIGYLKLIATPWLAEGNKKGTDSVEGSEVPIVGG